jgi:hypothetical protein
MARRALTVGHWLSLVMLLSACGSKEPNANPTGKDDLCSERVDRPGALPRPPTRGLPCELLPPGRQR